MAEPGEAPWLAPLWNDPAFREQSWDKRELLRPLPRMPLTEADIGAMLDLVGTRDRVRVIDGATQVRLEDTGGLLRTQIVASVRSGRSVIINHAETLSHVIRDLRCEIEQATQRAVEDCTLFLTPPGRAPLRAHVDAEHVITIQVAGAKEWTLAERVAARTTRELALPESDRRTVTLQAGEALYLPPGVPHVVRAHAEPSVSIAFGIERVSAVTVLRNVLNRYEAAQVSEEFGTDWLDREPDTSSMLRDVFTDDALGEALSITRGNVIRRMANGADTAWGEQRASGAFERTRVPMHVHADTTDAIVSVPEYPPMHYPRAAQAALRWIADQRSPFRCANVPEGLTDVGALLERFVDCGALQAVRRSR